MNECAQRNATRRPFNYSTSNIHALIVLIVVMSSAAKHILRRQGPPPQAVTCQTIQLLHSPGPWHFTF